MTYEEIKKQAIEQIEFIARTSEFFKIGKTSETVEDRVKDDAEYEKYTAYRDIFTHNDSKLIDQLEIDLISHFKKLFLNCDNKNDGGGFKLTNKVYVVYKRKFKSIEQTKSGIFKYKRATPLLLKK